MTTPENERMKRSQLVQPRWARCIVVGLPILVTTFFCPYGSELAVVLAQAVPAQFEDEDKGEEEKVDVALRELTAERKLLQKQLLAANDENSLMTATIRQFDKQIVLLQKIKQFKQQLERAEAAEDELRIEEYEEQIVRFAEQYERLQQRGEVETGLRESTFELREARREKDQVAVKQLPRIIATWQELLSLVKRLHQVYENGPETLEEPLEVGVEMCERIIYLERLRLDLQTKSPEQIRLQDVDHEKQLTALVTLHRSFLTSGKQLLEAYEKDDEVNVERLEERVGRIERRLQPAWAVFELTLELQQAQEQGNSAAVKELKNEIAALRGTSKDPPDGADSAPKTMPAPVAITEADRMAVAQLNFQQAIFPLLKTHCVRCHGSESQEGDLDLEKAATELPFVRNKRLWTSVSEHTKNRVMPPEAEDQPSDPERRTIAAWLEGELANFDYSRIDDPGYEPARRLTHQEYSNTVRDLLGIPLRVTDKFPIDLSGTSGFDNSANTLFVQPLLLERYLAAADEVVRQALPEKIVTPEHQQSWQRVFFTSSESAGSEESAASQILSRHLSRAYRRPVSARELTQSLEQYRRARQSGDSFALSIKSVIRASLISPKFLMKFEATRTSDQAYPVNDWELANRLAYFLWASMPDDELFRLAKARTLSDPDVLTEQVNRMLAEPGANTLGTVFAAQWLGFQHLGIRVRADPIDNPWCTDSLMAAMKSESAMFFTSLVRDNQPLQRLVNAQYTYLNEELANHYQLPDIKGNEMRRVALSTVNRGGIFTQGSLLAVTSFPGRTSPVIRGKWILEDVLGTPPPPPPPNVSEFSDEIDRRRSLTRRQKLELHRQQPNCYACHSQIDPLGFSLENYDWFGRFKTRSRRRPVDATGQFPDGTKFTGPAGLKKVIVEKRLDDLTRQLTQKMLAYALGRQLEYYDELAVRQIISRLTSDQYRFRTLIHAIVQSYPFRYKKNRVAQTATLSPKQP